MRARPPGRDQMGDPRRQYAGLADPGAGQNQDGAVEGLDGEPLLVVEPGEIGRRPCGPEGRCARAGGDARRPLVGSLGSLRHGTNHAPSTWEAQSALSTLFGVAARPIAREPRNLAQSSHALIS